MSKKIQSALLPASLLIILLVLIFLTYQVIISDKYYPITKVGDTNISFLTQGQAIRKLQGSFNKRINQKLEFEYAGRQFQMDLATTSVSLDYSALEGQFQYDLPKQLTALIFTRQIQPKVTLSLNKQIDSIAQSIYLYL